jgi:hypothetical protein
MGLWPMNLGHDIGLANTYHTIIAASKEILSNIAINQGTSSTRFLSISMVYDVRIFS